MSLRSLEAKNLASARRVLKNSKLRQKDILAWSNTAGQFTPNEGERLVYLPDLRIYIIVADTMDKRKK